MQLARKNVEIKKTYLSPVLRRLSLQQAKDIVCSRIKNIFKSIHSGSLQPITWKLQSQKKYDKPTLKKLTLEQAKLLLIGRANTGDENAIELLYSIFHEPDQDRQNRVS